MMDFTPINPVPPIPYAVYESQMHPMDMSFPMNPMSEKELIGYSE